MMNWWRIKGLISRTHRRRENRDWSSNGQDLVEFALIVPILFLFVFGTLDFARLFYGLIVAQNAAREGARYGIARGMQVNDGIYSPKVDEIIAAARAEAADSGVDLGASVVTVTCPLGCDSGNPLRVAISYRYNLLITSILDDTVLTFLRASEMMVP